MIKGTRAISVQAASPKRSMLPAGASARAGVGDPNHRPWKAGTTMLMSGKWASAKLVQSINGEEVELRGHYAGGKSARSWVRSVPDDVEVVS